MAARYLSRDEAKALTDRILSFSRAEQARVYTIGIGSERETAIPLRTEDRTVTFLEDEKGQPVMTRFNEGTLRRIATLRSAIEERESRRLPPSPPATA